MPNCHNCYPNCQWTVTHCWPKLALDTVLLSKVYWSYSTHIVRVCFTPLIKPTFKRHLKSKNILQINIDSPAMASLNELLCYHSLEHLDSFMEEFLTFIHPNLFSLYSFPAFSTVLPDATDGNVNDP